MALRVGSAQRQLQYYLDPFYFSAPRPLVWSDWRVHVVSLDLLWGIEVNAWNYSVSLKNLPESDRVQEMNFEGKYLNNFNFTIVRIPTVPIIVANHFHQTVGPFGRDQWLGHLTEKLFQCAFWNSYFILIKLVTRQYTWTKKRNEKATTISVLLFLSSDFCDFKPWFEYSTNLDLYQETNNDSCNNMNVSLIQFSYQIGMIRIKVLFQLLNIWLCRRDSIQSNIVQTAFFNFISARTNNIRTRVTLSLANCS